MPRPGAINPQTGKRYNFVDPKKREDRELQEINAGIRLLERKQTALLAQTSLLAYVKFTTPHPDDPNNHEISAYEDTLLHRSVAEALEGVVEGETPQLIFCMPPRHGKTQMATKHLAAWVSGKFPHWDIAVAAYNDTMAHDMGADTRAILTSKQHRQVFPGYRLRRGGTAKDNIQTDQGGRLVFVGRGGALTGRGMHVGIGDDLFKDHEEARSQAIRDQAWNWFTKVFMTRRMGRKIVILTMTRWHSDDIIGRITDPENPHYNAIEAKKWKIIRLPAIAEDDDPLGRKPGEALWPERYDLDFLHSQQRLDPLGFEALYQQRPTVADGVLFRRENVRYYDKTDLPANVNFYGASDHAVKTGQRNDFTVMLKAGVTKQSDIYLTECFWQKVQTNVAVNQMLAMARGDQKPLLWFSGKDHITGSIGPFLYKAMAEQQTYLNIRELSDVSDKEQKAQAIAALFALGKVYFPKGEPWVERAINELLSFPNGLKDDFVDALANLGRGLRFQHGKEAPAAKKEQPKFGTLAWVKLQDRWSERKRAEERVGGF